METHFGVEFFTRNRQKLVTMFAGKAPIVISANGLMQSSSDSTFPLRQDRNFWYLTGIDEPDIVLVIDRTKEYLILSEDHDHRVRFEGAKSAEAISEQSGISEVMGHKAGWQQLAKRLKKVKHVATIAAPPEYVKFHGFYSNPARATTINHIKAVNPQIELLDLRQHMSQMRIIKQREELLVIKRAIKITEYAIKSVTAKTWQSKTTEIDIGNELYYQFKKKGADGLAFDSVVSFGANTTAIHHRADRTKLQQDGLLLLDVGAEVDHYASDLSRLFVIGKPSKRMLQVYDAVLESLETALEMLRPGLNHRQFENDMEQVVGEKLRELGLIKNIDRESVRKYFPTYTSHQLGLDAHDIPDYERDLAVGMVMAVEPGIYIPEEGIGMRIEENVRISKNGIELMSTLPRDLARLTIK